MHVEHKPLKYLHGRRTGPVFQIRQVIVEDDLNPGLQMTSKHPNHEAATLKKQFAVSSMIPYQRKVGAPGGEGYSQLCWDIPLDRLRFVASLS